jgi:uncharacterized RDD family membrane protein YckC
MAEIVTGEAVALELPAAGFPSRIAARLIDAAAQFAVLVLASIAIGAAHPASIDYALASFLTVYVLVIVGYPTAFETLSRGKTLGKLALGVRVVGDDGSAVRFRQALVRALAGVIEIWALPPIALICSIASSRGKRVGDYFAGTFVLQERVPARQPLPVAFAMVPPPLVGWAQSLQVTGLSEQTAAAAGSYLRRFAELSPQARDALGVKLANAVAAQVSPPPPAGTPPAAYLSAVLAVRRQLYQPGFGPAMTGPGSWQAQQRSPAPAFRSESPSPVQLSAPPSAAEAPPAPTGFVPPA